MQSPTPGQQLQRVNDLLKQLRLAIAHDSAPGPNQEPKRPAVMANIVSESIAMGPDAVKYLIDHMETEGNSAQTLSDTFMLQGSWFHESSRLLRSEMLKHMKSRNADILYGSTWHAQLGEVSEMDIDRKKLFNEAKEFQVQVPMIDEKKLNEAIAAGKEIPGITIKKTQAVEFKLDKKTPPPTAH